LRIAAQSHPRNCTSPDFRPYEPPFEVGQFMRPRSDAEKTRSRLFCALCAFSTLDILARWAMHGRRSCHTIKKLS
ncbi:MAG TPA: hypothetical protein VGF52_00840, partial [Tepidisphaeraceae bacterium]